MYRFRSAVLLILLCKVIAAQEVWLQVREPERLLASGMSLAHDDGYDEFGFNLAVELIPTQKKISLSLDLAYIWRNESYPGYYFSSTNDENEYFREAYALGLIGRYYLIDQKYKLFGEVGFFYNHTIFYETLKIKTNYGLYEEFFNGSQQFISGTVCIGASIPLFWDLRCEPYIQFTLHTEPAVQGLEDPLLANSLYTLGTSNLFFYPFSLKIPLWRSIKKGDK